jgi:hypothetical protein
MSGLSSNVVTKKIDLILRNAFRNHPLTQENRVEWERIDMLIRHTLDGIKELHRIEIPRRPLAGPAKPPEKTGE